MAAACPAAGRCSPSKVLAAMLKAISHVVAPAPGRGRGVGLWITGFGGVFLKGNDEVVSDCDLGEFVMDVFRGCLEDVRLRTKCIEFLYRF